MGQLIRIRDPATGRAIVVQQEPIDYHPPPMPVYQDSYPVAAPGYGGGGRGYRRRRRGRGWGGRWRRKANTWLIGLPAYVFFFCMAGVHPGITIAGWGLLTGWLVYRSIRD